MILARTKVREDVAIPHKFGKLCTGLSPGRDADR